MSLVLRDCNCQREIRAEDESVSVVSRVGGDGPIVTAVSRVTDYFLPRRRMSLHEHGRTCGYFDSVSRDFAKLPSGRTVDAVLRARLNVTGRFQIRNMKSIWFRDEWVVVFQRE